MNLPNLVTLSRIPLMFAIVTLVYAHADRQPEDSVAAWVFRGEGWPGTATLTFLLFVLAGITDFLDGHLARRRGQVSNFGIMMDAVADKVMMLGIMIALVDLNEIPLALVLLILGREFLITGMRLVAASRGVVVAADRSGKQKTVTQIIAVGAFLLADVLRYDLHAWLSGALAPAWIWCRTFGLVVFAAATLFTLTSGVRYFRRYGALVFGA